MEPSPRGGLHQLPRRPLRCRVRGHVEVQHPPAVVGQHQKSEEHPEGGCWHREEVDRHQVLHVVVQERAPGWRRRLPSPVHVPGDGRLRDVDAELGELIAEARSAPRHVRPRHLPDQVDEFATQARPPPRRPALLRRFQKRLNPSRCHRITVPGLTIARAYRHASHRRDRTTHRARSQRPKRGRRSPRARASTPIWWRSARFSNASSRFVRKYDLAVPKTVRIKLNTRRTLPSQHAAAQGLSHG